MKQILRRALMTVFAATFMVNMAATAQTTAAQTTCTVAGAAGSYGLLESGSILNFGPRVAVGVLRLDAAGNLIGNLTANTNGMVSHEILRATFTVNPDCTGTLTFNLFDDSGNLTFTGTSALMWHSHMKAFDLIFVTLAFANGTAVQPEISGTAKRVD